MIAPDVEMRNRRARSRKALLAGGVGGTLAGVAAFYSVLAIAVGLGPESAYGYWLFLLVPTLVGFIGALISHRIDPDSDRTHLGPGLLSQAIIAVGLLLWHYEGTYCILMALPVTLTFSILGAWLAYLIRFAKSGAQVSLVPLILLAAIWDAKHPSPPNVHMESTSIVIHAPADKVWPYIVRLDHIRYREPLLELGFAHPVSIWADGDTPGSRRVCRLTTGDMPEVVTDSIPGRLFRFKVLSTPASMIETNPFGTTNPPHLHDNYRCLVGEYRLTALSPDQTRVEGVSWYTLRMAPEGYWTLWSDAVVDAIHRTDLRTIKDLAEGDQASSKSEK